MLVRTLLALSILSLPILTENARVMWLQNSTLIPTAITKFTKETALRVMSHQYMRPPRFSTIKMMIKRLIQEETRSKPMRMKVTMKMAAREMARDCSVSLHMVRYCS